VSCHAARQLWRGGASDADVPKSGDRSADYSPLARVLLRARSSLALTLTVKRADELAEGAMVHPAGVVRIPGMRTWSERYRPSRSLLLRIALAAVSPAVLFLIFRPDWYYRENGLVAYFYSGYTQNLGNLISISGVRHYFVSRWTLYLPGRVAFNMFGARGGFLALRWLFASAMVLAISALGHNRWRNRDSAAIVLMTLSSPLLLRTLLTDYFDSVVVPVGVLIIVLVALRPRNRSTAIAFGVGAAWIVIANPIAAAVPFCVIPAWVLALGGWRSRCRRLIESVASGSLVVLLGWAFFKYHFGLRNVYSPTIDFIKSNTSLQDPLKSPRLWWMGYRLWIYIPLLALGVWQYMRRHLGYTFDSTEALVLRVCATQYTFQVWFQFARHGSTLEIPYYWGLMVPSLLLALAVLVGKLAMGARKNVAVGCVAIVVFFILFTRKQIPELFSSWMDASFFIIAGAATYKHFGRRANSIPVALLVVVPFLLQAAGPTPEPQLAGEQRVNADYQTAYNSDLSDGVDGFNAATWFVERFQRLGSTVERNAYFWIGGAHANQLAAMYSAHVDGRWLNPGWGNVGAPLALTKDFTWAIGDVKIVNVIAMLGTSQDLATMTATLDLLRPGYSVLFQGQAPDRLHTEVRIISYP
jgi:hypothetical protein